MVRVWRHLASLRRSGQMHRMDNIINHRRSNSLAVRCPACPEPGFNVELADVQNASEDETCAHFLSYAFVGNTL